jgi:hypothetical protein
MTTYLVLLSSGSHCRCLLLAVMVSSERCIGIQFRDKDFAVYDVHCDLCVNFARMIIAYLNLLLATAVAGGIVHVSLNRRAVRQYSFRLSTSTVHRTILAAYRLLSVVKCYRCRPPIYNHTGNF